MAKIITTEGQQAAIRTINANLKELDAIRKYIERTNTSEEFSFIVVCGKDKLSLPADKKSAAELIAAHRKKLIKETTSLAKEHSVAFDADEEKLLR